MRGVEKQTCYSIAMRGKELHSPSIGDRSGIGPNSEDTLSYEHVNIGPGGGCGVIEAPSSKPRQSRDHVCSR